MKSRRYARIFEGFNRAGAALTLLALLGLIVSVTRFAAGYPYLPLIVLLAYAVGTILVVLAKFGRSGIRFSLKSVLTLTALDILLSFWDLVKILIGLPFIALTMVLGPLMTVVAALSAFVLGMYLVEEVIGYNIRGYTSLLKTGWQACIAAALMVASALVVNWHYSREGGADWLIDVAVDVSFSLRRRLQRVMREIIRKSRRNEE
jgi:hypothetical protein